MRPLASALILASTLLAAPACDSGDAADEEDPDTAAMKSPTLEAVSPESIALGDEVNIVGADFPDAKVATMALHLVGTYLDTDGKKHDYDGSFPVTVQNPSVATFTFEDLYFSPDRDKLGVFDGEAELVVQAAEGDPLTSAKVDIALQMLPSIRIDKLRASGAGCDRGMTGATTAGQPLELQATAIGLGEAAPDRPWQAKISFFAPEITAQYIVPGVYSFWPFDGPFDGSIMANAADGGNGNHLNFEVTGGSTVLLDPRTTEHKVTLGEPISINNEPKSEVVVLRLAAGTPPEYGRTSGNVTIQIFTEDGRALRRTATIDIYNEVELGKFDQNWELVERFAPQMTNSPSRAQYAIKVDYRDEKTETKTTSRDERWDVNTATSLGFSVGPSLAAQIQSSQNFGETIGMSVGQQVSSSTSSSTNVSADIIPSYWYVFYRQMSEVRAMVDVRYHGVCGASGVVGQVGLRSYQWGGEVAQGPDSPPETHLDPPCSEATGGCDDSSD